MKKFLLVTLISSFIIACGGGDGGSASAGNLAETLTPAEIEAKFNLPPEPTPDMPGFDTVEGIDSNGIRGRDDVERKIAFEFYKEEEKVIQLHALSEVHSKAVKAIESSNVESLKEAGAEYSQYNMCYIFSHAEQGARELETLDSHLYNTDGRDMISNSVSYDDGSVKSLDETVSYCKSKGFNIPF